MDTHTKNTKGKYMHHEHKSEKRVRISAYPKPKGIILPKNENYVIIYSLLLFLTCMNNQTVVGPLTSIVFFYFLFDLIL